RSFDVRLCVESKCQAFYRDTRPFRRPTKGARHDDGIATRDGNDLHLPRARTLCFGERWQGGTPERAAGRADRDGQRLVSRRGDPRGARAQGPRAQGPLGGLTPTAPSRAEDGPAHAPGERLERNAPEIRIAIGIEARRPDGDRRLARRDRKDAAADAALARQPDPVG